MSPLEIVPFATFYPLQKYLRGTCFSKKRLFQVDSIMINKTLAANLLHRSFYCPKFAAYGSMGHRRHSLHCCKAVHLIFFAAVLQKKRFSMWCCGNILKNACLVEVCRLQGFRCSTSLRAWTKTLKPFCSLTNYALIKCSTSLRAWTKTLKPFCPLTNSALTKFQPPSEQRHIGPSRQHQPAARHPNSVPRGREGSRLH